MREARGGLVVTKWLADQRPVTPHPHGNGRQCCLAPDTYLDRTIGVKIAYRPSRLLISSLRHRYLSCISGILVSFGTI